MSVVVEIPTFHRYELECMSGTLIECHDNVVLYEANHPELGANHIKRFRLRAAPEWKINKSNNVLKREMKILGYCDHPNIQKCHGKIRWSSQSVGIMLEPTKEGKLQDLLQGEQDVCWDERFQIARGIADAISHLHSKSIVHNAVRTENVVLSETNEVKLTNFSSARVIKNRSPSMESLNRKQKDSKPDFYSEPELQLNQFTTNEPKWETWMDVYSYAMVLYELITRRKIFEDEKPPCIFDILVNFKRPSLTPVNKVLESLTPDSEDFKTFKLLQNIMERCWQKEPEQRPTMSEVSEAFTRFVTKRAEEARKRNAEATRDTRDADVFLGLDKEAFDATKIDDLMAESRRHKECCNYCRISARRCSKICCENDWSSCIFNFYALYLISYGIITLLSGFVCAFVGAFTDSQACFKGIDSIVLLVMIGLVVFVLIMIAVLLIQILIQVFYCLVITLKWLFFTCIPKLTQILFLRNEQDIETGLEP